MPSSVGVGKFGLAARGTACSTTWVCMYESYDHRQPCFVTVLKAGKGCRWTRKYGYLRGLSLCHRKLDDFFGKLDRFLQWLDLTWQKPYFVSPRSRARQKLKVGLMAHDWGGLRQKSRTLF